jgi:hypothetical protein
MPDFLNDGVLSASLLRISEKPIYCIDIYFILNSLKILTQISLKPTLSRI